jgi:thiol-disulfide isomerase/thioredoxin
MKTSTLVTLILVVFGANLSFSQQKANLISFEQLNNKVTSINDSIYVVNFWATWCGPCLKELPDFEKFHSENTNPKVKLLLISFDFPNEIKKVNKFIEKKGLKPPVYIIGDTDQNAFIDKVSENWQGTIPATWFVNNKNGKKLFIEKPLKFEEIQKYVQEIVQ